MNNQVHCGSGNISQTVCDNNSRNEHLIENDVNF